jgi:hypothetical protein
MSLSVRAFGLFFKPHDIFFEIRNHNMIAKIFNTAIGVSFKRLLYVFMFFDWHRRLLGVLYSVVSHKKFTKHRFILGACCQAPGFLLLAAGQ